MKKLSNLLSILLACVMSIALTGCSSDIESGGGTPVPPIDITQFIGTWQCTYSVDNFQGEAQLGLLVGKVVTINDDGTFTSNSQMLGLTGTYTVNNNIIKAKSTTASFTFTPIRKDKTMTWNGFYEDGTQLAYAFIKQ